MSTAPFAKYKFVAAGLLVLLVATALVLLFSRYPSVAVHGNLSPLEVSEIVRAVKHDMWHEAFPDHSWQTIKRAPRALWAVSTARISEVTQTFENAVQVEGELRLENRVMGPGLMASGLYNSWALRKKSGEWTVRSRGRRFEERRPRYRSLEEAMSFSSALSNDNHLSLDAKRP